MGLVHSPRIVTDNMVLCCDGQNKRTFTNSVVGLAKSESWNFTNTATGYNSDIDITYSPDLNRFAGVNNSQYIVGYSGTDNKQVQTSNSGASGSWVARSDAHAAQWTDICWGEAINGTSKYVAVAYSIPTQSDADDDEKFMYSTTGISGWTTLAVTGTNNVNFRAIGAGNSTFIAVGKHSTTGDGEVWKSEYGSSSWSSKTGASDADWFSICWGNTGGSDGTWVGVAGDGTDRIMYSTDNGDTWSNSGVQGFSDSYSWRDVTYGKDKFVAVADEGRIAYSTNGISWTIVDNRDKAVPDLTYNYSKVVYGDGYFMTSGGNGIQGRGCIWISGDGIDWTQIDRVAGFAATSFSWTNRPAFGNDKFILSNSVIETTWSADLFGHDEFNRICYSDALSTINNNVWTDISKKNNNITLYGPSFSQAEGILNFDGTNDYASISSNSDIAFGTGDFAVEMWVKFYDLTNNCVLWDTRSSTAATDGYLLYASSSNNWVLYTNDTEIIQDGSAVTDTWYHVVVTKISNTTTLYVNGFSIDSFSDNYNYSADDVFIGKSLSSDGWLDGYLGLIRAYKGRGLSANQVNQNLNSTRRRFL